MALLVIFKPKDALQCEARYFGPYPDIGAAMDKIQALPVAAECDAKFIAELEGDKFDRESFLTMRTEDLETIIRSTSPDGKFARQLEFAKAELLRRASAELLAITLDLARRSITFAKGKHEKKLIQEARTAYRKATGIDFDMIAQGVARRA